MDIAGLVLGYIAVIGGLAISAVALVLGIRHDRRKRELEHIERMHALELGRTLPQDSPWWSPSRIAVVIGGVVPVAVFVTVGGATRAAGFHEGMWLAAAIVGMAAVICGSILAVSKKSEQTSSPIAYSKPHIEEDAYDVVGTRG
jgi:hypothetical protein